MIDYVSTLSLDFSLILPELSLLVVASLLLMVACVRRLASSAPAIAAAGLLIAFLLSMDQWGHQGSGFAGMVTCDSFGIMFKMIFTAATLIVMFLGQQYMIKRGLIRAEYYALLLFSTVGMMVLANSSDLVVLFLGLEIMSMPLYVLAGFSKRSLESNEAGIKYFIMGAFATAFLLLGIAFVYGAAETTNLRSIAIDFNYIVGNFQTYLYAGAALILVGFGFKVAAVPFHSWVPDVYQGAPTPVTAFFSVAPKAAGFAALLRIFVFAFGEIPFLTDVFWVLAVLTMSLGNVLALRQNNVKRMLAYSSISHAGYIMVSLVVGGPSAVSAAMFYLSAYTMFNLGAFAVITVLENRTGCKSEYTELSGLSVTNPWLAALLALFMFALAGFPPTAGFFAKFYLFSTAVHDGFIWLAVIGVMNSFVSVYYYLRVIKCSYFDKPEAATRPALLDPAVVVALIITAVGTLGLGFFPGHLLDLSRAAIFGMP